MSNTYLLATALLNGTPTPPPPVVPPVDNSSPTLKTNFSDRTTPLPLTNSQPSATPIPLAPTLVDNSAPGIVTNLPIEVAPRNAIAPANIQSPSPSLFPSPTPEFTPSPLNFTPPPQQIIQTYLPPELPRPKTGSQMLSQRIAALQAGVTYTRIPTDTFMEFWQKADSRDPTYEQWQSLLIQEAKALAYGQGNNRLSVMVGDSLTMWFPTDKLSKNNLWLNQGISGENTTQILRRLKYKDFGQTRPDRIFVMAGVNDLRQGASDQTILNNHRQIMRQLKKDYPQAEIIVQSILPTRFASIPDRRLRSLNQQLENITTQEGVSFLNLYDIFLNQEGQLRRELTTDGIHLSMAGYETWSWSINP